MVSRNVGFSRESADILEISRDQQHVDSWESRLAAFGTRTTPQSRARSTRILAVLTEAAINPGGFGPTRIYKGGSAQGTPNTPDTGQLQVHLDWAHSDELISIEKEAFAAYFPDMAAEGEIEGACFTAANSDYISIPFEWGNLNGSAWEISLELTIDDISADRPILSAYNNTGTPNDNFIAFRTSGDLEAFFGDGISDGVDGVTFDVATYPSVADFYDGTLHTFRLTYNGSGTFELFNGSTSIGTEVATDPSFESQTPIRLGGWDKTTSDAYMQGKMRNFRLVVAGVTEVLYPLDEMGSVTVVEDHSGNANDGTLSSSSPSSVWAANTNDGHSGWRFIGAECETTVETIAEP